MQHMILNKRTRLSHTQHLSLGPKTPSSFISLLAINIVPLDPLDSSFLLVSSNFLATLGTNNIISQDTLDLTKYSLNNNNS